jgi:hypothetical protein
MIQKYLFIKMFLFLFYFLKIKNIDLKIKKLKNKKIFQKYFLLFN